MIYRRRGIQTRLISIRFFFFRVFSAFPPPLRFCWTSAWVFSWCQYYVCVLGFQELYFDGSRHSSRFLGAHHLHLFPLLKSLGWRQSLSPFIEAENATYSHSQLPWSHMTRVRPYDQSLFCETHPPWTLNQESVTHSPSPSREFPKSVGPGLSCWLQGLLRTSS